MAKENFSFPRVRDTNPNSTDSPPLRNLSTAKAKYGQEDEKDQHFEAKMVTRGQRRSFSYVENGRKSIGQDLGGGSGGGEDKMDLLWANFNEELSPRRRSDPPLTVAKANMSALFSSKNKLSMVAIVKILRKLFSFKNPRGKMRESTLR